MHVLLLFSKTVKKLLFLSDIEPPVTDFCQSPPIFLVDSPQDLELGYITDIEWSEPIFHDNSLDELSIDVDITTNDNFADGRFAIGETTKVVYRATDSSGNNSTCSMEISVQGKGPFINDVVVVQFQFKLVYLVLSSFTKANIVEKTINNHSCLIRQ